MTEHINYAEMVNDSMRRMIKEVLHIAEAGSIPGEHHFYITFVTNMPGVKLSKQLKARFPDEMTIVLQYEYENLHVSKDEFTVDLRFGGVLESLTVPFYSIVAFADPSSKFALHFEAFDGIDTIDDVLAEESAIDLLKNSEGEEQKPADVISLDKYRK